MLTNTCNCRNKLIITIRSGFPSTFQDHIMFLKHYTTHYTPYTWERINPSTPNICLVNKFAPKLIQAMRLFVFSGFTHQWLFFLSPSLVHCFLVSEPSYSLVMSQTSNPHDDFSSSLTGPQIAASLSISSAHLERGQQRDRGSEIKRGAQPLHVQLGMDRKWRVSGRVEDNYYYQCWAVASLLVVTLLV